MDLFNISHPTATVSRGIENIVIEGRDSDNLLVNGACFALSRVVALTVFPIFIFLELVFMRVPKLFLSIGNSERFNKNFDKVVKFTLGFICFPIGIYSPEGISGFYLQIASGSRSVLPFGVEGMYGLEMVNGIFYPKTVEELQKIVRQAKTDGKQVSVIGAGMSQGTQTTPKDPTYVVVNTKHLNAIALAEDRETVVAQSGATWERLQLFLDKHEKSAIVKQASDPFSIGGSIGINCHGWAHEYGALSSTVESLEIIDANGDIQVLTPDDELFGCMFGTLGYFGIVVSATLKIVDNECLVEKVEEIDISAFDAYYKAHIKGKGIPLFGGRLNLDTLHGDPLRTVCMVRYEKDPDQTEKREIALEPTIGVRRERINLQLAGHLPHLPVARALSGFWDRERQAMLSGRHITRNEALHPPINAFKMLHASNLHTQWLQEYFIKEDNLEAFLRFLGAKLKENNVRLINATIRRTPKDDISILPYAEQDRYAVVICFSQMKTKKEIEQTRQWIEDVNAHLCATGDIFYQAYMPYATKEQFEQCYGRERIARLRALKKRYDSQNLFGNRHTAKYYDALGEAASPYRQVFQTTHKVKEEFRKFLRTIFYILDEEKVFKGMEEILEDSAKTDEQVYTELLEKIGGMKKKFSFLKQLHSLRVLKDGMGSQAAALLTGFAPSAFSDYMEIYDRRYLTDIRKKTGFPFKGKTIAAADGSAISLADRVQAGAVFSRYPYKMHVPLNDSDCTSPAEHPEKTCKPIGDEVESRSLDLIACLGGLHHVPPKRVDPFIASLKRTLRPGGVLLMRDHDVKSPELSALVSVVHTFVNASNGVPWEVESKEPRHFKSMDDWVGILEKGGFMRISPKYLVLKDDPTENGMVALIRRPHDLKDMKEAIQYRNDCDRGKDGTRATWIEWGNVRFSKQYAEFIQDHHSYAFDYIGHLRQHWVHFANYIRECLNDDVALMKLIASDNFAMNIFILFSAAIQCVLATVMSLPSMCLARWQNGKNWREVSHLTSLEKYTASVEKEYSEFIDHTPFYMFDYLGKIRGGWRAIIHSQEGIVTKVMCAVHAILWSLGMVMQAAISAPVRAMYTAEANLEPDTVKVLLHDPKNELKKVSERWDGERGSHAQIEEIYSTPDGYKLVSFPRYRPFTQICEYMSRASELKLLEVGGQDHISVDVLLDAEVTLPEIQGTKRIYTMEKLQDPKKRHYETYHVAVSSLKTFVSVSNVEYIHE